MLLTIDIGNTNTVFALFQAETVTHKWRFQTNTAKTEDEYAASLMELFKSNHLNFAGIDQIVVSSVVPDANFAIEKLAQKYCRVEPHFITHKDFQFDIALPKPHEVGADRLVNVVAALDKYNEPLIIVDFGTATTFDVVNSKGQYIGGAIAPGINLSLDALYKAAAKLPRIDMSKAARAIGNDTISAMQSGMYWGYTSMIDGMLTRMKAELNNEPVVLATGGLAELFIKDLPQVNHIDQDLTLHGLCLLARSKPALSSAA